MRSVFCTLRLPFNAQTNGPTRPRGYQISDTQLIAKNADNQHDENPNYSNRLQLQLSSARMSMFW